MMKKSKSISILALLLVFSLSSCDSLSSSGSNSSSTDESTSQTEGDESSEETGTSGSSGGVTTKTFTYEHSWTASDFGDDIDTKNNVLTAGSTEIDGLTWSYTGVSTFFNNDASNGKGLQIGSSNHPETDGWTLSTDFGEDVTLTSFSMMLSVGSGGSATYTLNADNSSVWTGTFSDSSVGVIYSNTSLNEDCSSLSLTLKASSKAMYIDTMSFTLIVAADSKYEGEVNSGDSELASRDPVTPGKNDVPSTKYTLNSNTVTNYYSSIDMSETGTKLEQDLHELISTMTKYSYGDCRYMLLYTDESITNSGYVYGAYDGDLLPAVWDSGVTWNREHTWPRARMGGEEADNNITSRTSDLHNIRVTCGQANSKRGDVYFDLTTSSSSFYPNYSSGDLAGSTHRYEGDFRGDVARICFYMYVRYGRYDDEITLNLSSDINDMDSSTMGNLSTLLQWNTEDPVDEFETQRNNRIYEYQGNRNPFIDYPNLANNLFI